MRDWKFVDLSSKNNLGQLEFEPNLRVDDAEGPWEGEFFQIKAKGAAGQHDKDSETIALTMMLIKSPAYAVEAQAVSDMLADLPKDIADGPQTGGPSDDCISGDSCSAIANPIPGAIWLFGSALLGLLGVGGYRSRRR